MERLQKVIANSGYTSRRKAEELIINNHVKVNGKIINELGIKVSDSDEILIDNNPIAVEDKVYFLLNKPRGVVTTTSDDKNRKTVIDLIDTDKRIYPVGRLDYDTTGALILTNDGDFANMLMHPSNNIDKVYIAKIEGLIKGDSINRLKSGVIVDGKMTSKARVKLKHYDKDKNYSIVELTIHEGRNHQIKKMFESVGFRVEKLKRERIANLDVKNLTSGEYRPINPKEIKQLYSFCKK